MLNEPFATAARGDGLTPLVDLAAEKIPWLFSTLVVSQRYLDGKPRRREALPARDR